MLPKSGIIINTIIKGVPTRLALIWFLAQIPTIMPITQLISEAITLTAKKPGINTRAIGTPLMISTAKLIRTVIINGKKDPSFLIEGARRGFETVKAVYARENASDKCRLIETEEGHYWCEDIIWEAINEETKRLK